MTDETVLLVGDERAYASISDGLRSAGWAVEQSTDPDAARLFARREDVPIGLIVFTPDLCERVDDIERLTNIGRTEWIALLPQQAKRDRALDRLLISSFYDHHTLPVDMERLLVVIGHARGRVRLKDRVLARPGKAGRYGMVGASMAMQQLFGRIDRMTRVDAPVLITGESGTGKELVARAIHQHSSRASGTFVPVNCGALPDSLVQAELFGYEKGAFTGAHQRKVGSFEAAAGGTIFLDEIGDLPLDQQANLLRFLQEKTIVRIGSTRHLQVDARVIAATHVDLERAVREQRFREDLYYRLNVLQLHVPALRDRGRDVELLIDALFERFAEQKNPVVQGFSDDARHAALAYGWPGNVRELMNRVQRAMIMSETPLIGPTDLGLQGDIPQNVITLSRARSVAERDAIRATLRSNANNVSRAARELGVSRVTLYRLMEKFDIDLNREE